MLVFATMCFESIVGKTLIRGIGDKQRGNHLTLISTLANARARTTWAARL